MDLGLKGKICPRRRCEPWTWARGGEEELGREGCDLVMCGAGAEALAQRAPQSGELECRSRRRRRDLSMIERGGAAPERASRTRFRSRDILVTNAGVRQRSVRDASAEACDAAVPQNLVSVVELNACVLPSMRRDDGAHHQRHSLAVKHLRGTTSSCPTAFARRYWRCAHAG